MADTAGAYWLIDEIVFAQSIKRVATEKFQSWTLKVDLPNKKAVLTCTDGGNEGKPKTVYTKNIAFTDFPEESVEMWFTDKVILLPSEY